MVAGWISTHWREIAEENHDYLVERIFRKSTILEIHDTLFRSNSCVVLPEGETPDSDKEHGSISSVGLFATALRYNEENPGKSLFIAGHTDSTATVEFNQTLSEERAKCALSVLEGDRDAFINLVNKRHKVSDYKQIFSWCCKAFEDLSFNCDPGAIDDNEYSGIESVKQFQKDYNTNKSAMGYDSHADLSVDGDIGPLTWGAIFDVYEYALRQELGADIPELAELRNKVDWVDDDRKALGFSEHHPIDKVGLDNTRSQANRRVEFLFFEAGDEPDLILAESDPDLSDIYLTEEYKHASIEPMLSALPWKAEWLSADSSANMETPKTMQVTAPGLPSGQPCSLELFAEANGEEAFLLKAFVVSSADNQVSKDNSLWYDPSKSQVKQDHLEVLPAFKFYFTLSAGGRTVTSPKILYADKLELRFVHSGTEIPPEDRQVLVATPWGRIEKELTEEGKFILENIPPGGARVVSFSERLVTEA